MNWLRTLSLLRRPRQRTSMKRYLIVGKTKDGSDAWGAGLSPQIAMHHYLMSGGEVSEAEWRDVTDVG